MFTWPTVVKPGRIEDEFDLALHTRDRWWVVGSTHYMSLGHALRAEFVDSWLNPIMRVTWIPLVDRWGRFRVELQSHQTGEWVLLASFFSEQAADRLVAELDDKHTTVRKARR